MYVLYVKNIKISNDIRYCVTTAKPIVRRIKESQLSLTDPATVDAVNWGINENISNYCLMSLRKRINV